jgi:uncharacterized protein (TIGR03435 family)
MANRITLSFVLGRAMKIAVVLATSLLLAQSAPPRQFDVASVKVNTSRGKTTRRDEPQGLTYLNISMGEFIGLAYGVRSYQIDGPEWITNNGTSTRFDIVAKASAPMTVQELHAALGPLLADRFHLMLHRETRTLPVYLLVVDKDGPKFKEGDGGESSVMPDPATGGVRYANYPIAALAATLSLMPSTGRPVLDRTGLTGKYTFAANLFDIPAGLSIADEKRSIARSETPAFTALREQLGLRLEPDRAPIEMLVIDRADRVPTED